MNILLNNYCNLKCEYCFQHKVIEQDKQEMSITDFRWLLDFLRESNMREVRLIGGEPTLHPRFVQLLQEQLFDDSIEHIHIFSNGTFNDQVQKQIANQSRIKGVSILLNINDLSHNDFQDFRLRSNLDLLKRYNITLTAGINIYKSNQDFSYFFNIVEKFGLKRVRWTITTPQKVEDADIQEYFEEKMQSQMDFIYQQVEKGLQPSPDCNRMPTCMIPEKFLRDLQILEYNNQENHFCEPVLDVQPNMNVIRCFMFSEYPVDIRNFSNAEEIRDYFIENIDKKLEGSLYQDYCKDCLFVKRNGMSCGCKQFYKGKLNSNKEGIQCQIKI